MSFAAEILTRRVAVGARTSAAPRTFTTCVTMQRSATDAVRDGMQKVNQVVGEKLSDGIDMGSAVMDKVKEATANTRTTSEVRHDVMGKAAEAGGKMQGAVAEAAGKTKGAAAEVKGKAMKTANEVAGEAHKQSSEGSQEH